MNPPPQGPEPSTLRLAPQAFSADVVGWALGSVVGRELWFFFLIKLIC